MRIALRGWDGELVDEEDQLERERTRYVLRDGAAGAAAGLAAHAAHAAGAADARAGACVAHEPPRGAAAARAPRLSGRGLPHRAVAARGRHPASACALRHQFRRGGDAGACAGRAAVELHRPWPGGVRQGPLLGLAEKIRRCAFVVAISSYGRSQLYRLVEHQHWPKVHVVHCGLEPAFHAVARDSGTDGAAPRLRWPAVRAERASCC